MKLRFYKYHGTGNDFILIDNRRIALSHDTYERYGRWCHRRFGIGADGLILLEEEAGYDFRMVYYNSDGRQSSMCGNGGRCIVQFAHDLGIIGDRARFMAIDGEHEARVSPGRVELKMGDVDGVEKIGADFYLNTGSPHLVRFKEGSLGDLDLIPEARAIRYGDRFREEGTNVNLVSDCGDYLDVRTYERGVEDETYSCGTGVTAVALVQHLCSAPGKYVQKIQTPGGNLEIRFEKTGENNYRNIWLCGPAEYVFEGEIDRE